MRSVAICIMSVYFETKTGREDRGLQTTDAGTLLL
jgi:hypothetical protein